MLSFLNQIATQARTHGSRLWTVIANDPEVARKLIGLVVSVGVWGILMLMPTPEALGIGGQRAVALLASVCIMFATEAVPLPAIGLLIPVYQVVVGGMPT